MKSKKELFDLFTKDSKKNYKSIFLLAWARFLTYDELDKYDQLEVFDAEMAKGKIRSKKGWNDLVIQYTEENIKKALCIEMYRVNHILSFYNDDNLVELQIRLNDVLNWLFILDDNEFNLRTVKNKKETEQLYTDIAKKYKFEIIK